jgi:hypothetical protein
METYYLSARFIRCEDYIWELASKINIENLTPHLARRYGEALFWQKKYKDVIDWFRSPKIEKILENDSEMVMLSVLYLAESYFQTEQWKAAQDLFKIYSDKYPNEESTQKVIRYRLAQLDLLEHQDAQKGIREFYQYYIQQGSGFFYDLGVMQWARLVVKANHRESLSFAHEKIMQLIKSSHSSSVKRDAFVVKAVLEWDMGNAASALNSIKKVVRPFLNPETMTHFDRVTSDLSMIILATLAPQFWATKDYAGFLVEANTLRYSLEVSKYRFPVMEWIGRAYVETGMMSSGARMFQRLLLDAETPDKDRVMLELAQAYGRMGDTELMERAVALIESVPGEAADREFYYLTKVALAIKKREYGQCTQLLDTLMQQGIQGDHLFEYSLHAARCARKGNLVDQANRYLAYLGIEKTLPAQPAVLEGWQLSGYLERINLNVVEKKFQEATEMFEALPERTRDFMPPLDTVFAVIDAYRYRNEPDRARIVWKDYGSGRRDVLKSFDQAYSEVLDLLSRIELVQNVL